MSSLSRISIAPSLHARIGGALVRGDPAAGTRPPTCSPGSGHDTITFESNSVDDAGTVTPGTEPEDVARLMTQRRVRPAPVTVDGGLRGIVSIGDGVKSRIGELENSGPR